MQKLTVLFYIDSLSTVAHCAKVAEIARDRLGARVVVMAVDSAKLKGGVLDHYEVYDYASLFRDDAQFPPAWGSPPAAEISVPCVGLGDVLWNSIDRLSKLVRVERRWRHKQLRLRQRQVRTAQQELSDAIRDAWSTAGRSMRTSATTTASLAGAAVRSTLAGAAVRSTLAGAMLTVLFAFILIEKGVIEPARNRRHRRLTRARQRYRAAMLTGLVYDGMLYGSRLLARLALRIGSLVHHSLRRTHSISSRRRYARAINATELGDNLKHRVIAQNKLSRFAALTERLVYWIQAINGVRRFVAYLKPDIVVLAEDNIETISRAFVRYAQDHRAKTIVIPTTIPNPLEPAQFYFDDARHLVKGTLPRTLATFFPKWTFRHAGRRLIRLEPAKIVAIEAFGLSTPAPWILNRGSSDAIALDSHAMRVHYAKLGFPSSQLRVIGDATGSALDDIQRNAPRLRRQILEELGMKPGRPLIVCAFPPDQYSGSSSGTFEFPTFDDMVDAWFRGFAELGDAVNVVIRPHPRLDLRHLASYERSNIRITAKPTVEIVPLADLYVASISATIRWAISCGIPVINYDSYRYRYGDYEAAAGVVHVEAADEYVRSLKRFFEDEAFARALRKRQIEDSRYWGLVDDKFDDRIAGLILELAARKP